MKGFFRLNASLLLMSMLYNEFIEYYHRYNITFLDSNVYDKVCTELTKSRLVSGIKQASPLSQTSCLEGFHSVLNYFAPKMIGYSYRGMLIR